MGNTVSVTPELYDLIVKIVEDKVREIKVTREEFDKLVKAVRELAEKVDELAEAQRRTEERVNELAEAQRRTEESLHRLNLAVTNLSTAVGRLSDTIGFGLEDVARVMIPGWLERHEGIKVGELERKFFTLDGETVEIDIYGEGEKEGREVIILGEVKSRIHERDVREFLERAKELEPLFKGKEIYKIVFGFLIYPKAEEVAKKHGIRAIASYMR